DHIHGLGNRCSTHRPTRPLDAHVDGADVDPFGAPSNGLKTVLWAVSLRAAALSWAPGRPAWEPIEAPVSPAPDDLACRASVDVEECAPLRGPAARLPMPRHHRVKVPAKNHPHQVVASINHPPGPAKRLIRPTVPQVPEDVLFNTGGGLHDRATGRYLPPAPRHGKASRDGY
ncbi:MAG TPA: hypothetical protein DGT23_13570, partial [Micromonosporaceae bacterium]|nr:hypothetical protein [Micromonosporaceae bacterium]